MPLGFHGDHGAGGADEDGGVDVVPAGVHDGNGLAGAVFHGDVAGVGDAGFFGDGERVHVGADHERGTGAVFQDGDDAVGLGAVRIAADAVGDGVARVAEGCGEDAGGAGFEVGELGVGVNVFVGVDEGGGLVVDEGGESSLGRGGGGECGETRQGGDDGGLHGFSWG